MKLNFIKCAALAAAGALLLCSCSGGTDTSSSKRLDGVTSSGNPAGSNVSSQQPNNSTSSNGEPVSSQVTVTVNDNGTYFSTDVWQAVPMVSAQIKNNGYKGGEGGQWMNYAVFDSVDGKLAFAGTDVGRTHRSTDGGKTWEPATIGLNNRGSVGVAIDHKNTNNVLLVSGSGSGSGLYRSTDGGVTWSCVLEFYLSRSHDWRNMIAFDTTTGGQSGSTTAYWLSPVESHNDVYKYGLHLGLHRSTDGGKTWKYISGTEQFAGGWLEIDAKGRIFIVKDGRVYRSANDAKGWDCILDDRINCVEVIHTKGYENYVYALGNNNFYVSTNAGNSFTVMSEMQPGAYRNYTYLAVSPADPKRMIMQNDKLTKSDGSDYTGKTYYSHNGGKTWSEASFDYSNAWLPYNVRQRFGSFHPTDKNVSITLGGDFLMRSTDGGKSYVVSSSGYNAILATDISININNPNLMAISAQDYNGGYSTDGGKTWNYINWNGSSWGGHTYGIYPISDKVIVACYSSEWRSSPSAKKEMYITYDGGKTITKTGNKITGELFGCGAKGDNNVAFIGEWRTTDGGKTWSVMNGCTGVLSVHSQTGWLFGLNKYDIVMSKDNGQSWTTLVKQGECRVNGIAYNHKSGKVFFNYWAGEMRCVQLNEQRTAAAGDAQKALDYTYYVSGVAVDPQNNDIMYITCYTNRDHQMHNTWRSLDGGKTWTGLSRQAGDGRTGPDGGNDGSMCIVHPTTRELFTISHCNGMWKIAPPPQQYYK